MTQPAHNIKGSTEDSVKDSTEDSIEDSSEDTEDSVEDAEVGVQPQHHGWRSR